MYTKQMAEENEIMLQRAITLWYESGYDPRNTPVGDGFTHREFLRPYLNYVQVRMENEFTHVHPERIRSRITRARTIIYSQWVRTRGLQGE